ncbi:zinc-finger of the MIZ type in Nse subunit-domain-containing protein [Daldinia caldariorum]|uniref:zinc-finger of the MIZ type in Nse subunit-domain-containing protein n=1 Tax=Daldinia caldariorum TaxID=326644 RepID=UPI002007BAB8|nr:zinc-finger of the MIZ type in Nse subunit-domain-containing protein [Daldinia caldariorum]KAI1472632.1 zinc-finger of the MIZ type in Nse subunit-domain-containing protein [Daldinia caldariorum]
MPLLSGSRRLQSGAERNRGRPSAPSSHTQQDNGPVELPNYEPLACPLSAEYIRALTQLSTSKDTRKYEEQLNKSIELLSASVRDLNDKYEERKEALKKLQEKRADKDEKSDRERAEEKAVLALKNEVPTLTNDCNLAVQSVIDLKIELEDGNAALRRTAQNVETEAANAARRRRGQGGDEDEDEEMADVNITSPIELLEQAKKRAADDYASKTPYEKYGTNNDYIGFKRMWHDAVYGRGNKPLPHASKWFSQNGGEDEASDDDDLIVAEEHLDIRCPLSLVVMKDPYTSTKCRHTFEKDSIIQFLGNRRARCPQAGCNKEVTISDFHPDPVMLRNIKRQLASQRPNMADDDEDEDEDEDEGEQDIDVDGDSHVDATPGRSVKSERGG